MRKENSGTFKIIFAAITGLILEFYDFTIYAVFAVKIGERFFPNASEFAQILSTLAVLAVGFFMRPVGGALFGHIGDKHGRRLALIISVIGMATITLGIGLMPDYYSIGILAPILLVVLRMLQGLCVGGEGAGASIFVLEHLHKIKPGLVGGIMNAALTFGILLAILTGMALNSYFGADSEAWRYAFFIGAAMGLVGLYLRLSIDETPIFKEILAKKKVMNAPLKEVFKTNMRGVILTIAAGAITSVSAYVIMTFLGVYFKSVMFYPDNTALYYGAFGNLLLVIFLPLMGMVSDKIGYTRSMVISSILLCALSIPLFKMLSSNNEVSIYTSIIILSIIVSLNYAPLYPFMLKLFSPEQRYSGIACCLNVGIATFGGSSNMIYVALIKYTGVLYAPAYYISAIAALFVITIMLVKPKRVILEKSENSLYAESNL